MRRIQSSPDYDVKDAKLGPQDIEDLDPNLNRDPKPGLGRLKLRWERHAKKAQGEFPIYTALVFEKLGLYTYTDPYTDPVQAAPV